MSEEPMTETQMRALADTMLVDYNRHDVESLVAHLTEDVVWTEPTLPGPAHGRRAVASSLQDTFRAFPDLRVDTETFRFYPDAEDQSGAARWSLVATMTGPLDNGIPATGRTMHLSGVNLVKLRDGLISEYTFCYDSLAMMQQLGLLPRSSGLGFKAIVMADVMAHRALKVLQRQ